MAYRPKASSWRAYDISLLLATVAVAALGVAMVSSSVRGTPGMEGAAKRQAISLGVGLLFAVLVSALDYRLVVGSGIVVYGMGLAGLLVVGLLGTVAHGGQRWLNVGGFTFQPSELMKICLAVILAQYLAGKVGKPWRFRHLIGSCLITGVPVVLVYSQPDLGTALVFIAIWGVMVLIAGVDLKYLLLLFGGGVAALPIVWLNLEGYMKGRLLAFVSPGSDPKVDYMRRQALISIGSGGMWGQGYGTGNQSRLRFLIVPHSDFIFSVIGEELGFIGAVLTLALLAFICYRLFAIAQSSYDAAGRLLVCGIAGMIAYQTVVHVGMNVGWIPVTGLPLPLVSLGGSALVSQFVGIGLAESVAVRRRLAFP